jgi:hypothetical protein
MVLLACAHARQLQRKDKDDKPGASTAAACTLTARTQSSVATVNLHTVALICYSILNFVTDYVSPVGLSPGSHESWVLQLSAASAGPEGATSLQIM